MAFNKAIIPLYINTDILNNLFTIVIQEFVEIKSVSVKDQVQVHLKAPISEFSYDLCGKYIQGDFDIYYTNEYAKQRTEEKISTSIIIMKKLRDILIQQNLLKFLDDESVLNSIEEYDYVDFNCELKRNPVIQNVYDTIDAMELRALWGSRGTDKNETNDAAARRANTLNYLKNGLDSCRKERCIRYIGENICNSNTKIVVPLKTSNMLDYEDYMLNGRVRVMGKVVKIQRPGSEANNSRSSESYNRCRHISLMSDTNFDNIDYTNINSPDSDILGILTSLNQKAVDIQDQNYTLIEVLPVWVYI